MNANVSRCMALLSVVALGNPALGQDEAATGSDADQGGLYSSIQPKANAAGFDEQHRTLEEVFVTARRREELLQETPVSVSAFTAGQLEEAGIHSIVDLENSVPNLQFSQATTKDQVIFIRGMGQRTDVSIFDPSVGVYLNSILIPRHDAALLETVDIESVQVLRGPQGTLFGKNNTGGAILFGSKQPDLEEFSGALSLRAGSFGRRDARLTGNVPLLEGKLGLRFAVNRTRMDGYLDNTEDDTRFGDENRRSASARLLWFVNEAVSVDLFGFFSRTREQGLGPNCILQNLGASMPNLIFPAQPPYAQACNASEAVAEDRKVTLNAQESAFEIDSTITALTVNWDINENLRFKSITGFSQWDDILRSDDADASAANNVISAGRGVQRTFQGSGFGKPQEERWYISQEFQFNGNAMADRLQYTVGAFASRENIDDAVSGTLVGAQGIGGIKPSLIVGILEDNGSPVPPELLVAAADDTTVVPFVEWLGTISDLRNESVAVFGEFTYEVLDWLQFTLGGRYTTELRERSLVTTEVDHDEVGRRIGAVYNEVFGVYSPISKEQFDAIADDPRTLPLIDRRETSVTERFNEFTPSATINMPAPPDWLGLDKFMIYFSASKGFKAGGFDAKGTELVTVEPERVTNFELGFKLDALTSRLRVNGAIFHTKWKDMQLQVAELGDSLSGTEILLFFTNAGEATTQGVELESSLSVAGFLFQANASYLDASYDEFMASAVTPFVGERRIDRSDEDLFMAPEVTWSLAAQYHLITPIGLVIPRLSYSYRDKAFTGLDFLAAEFGSSYGDEIKLLNFRATYLPSEALRLTFYANNLQDNFYYISGTTNSDALGAAMLVQGPGRQLGLELNWEF